MTPGTPALELAGLDKTFGRTHAVDAVTLVVPAGSFYGVVGPNGAGKTTALSMAVGLLRPDAGTSRIFGLDVWRDPVHAKAIVGVLPDGLLLPERLTGRELLTYLGRLHGLTPANAGDRADELLSVLDLDGAEDTLVIEYSTGMRKKIGLAAALIHAPRLLVLDEPFEARRSHLGTGDPGDPAAVRRGGGAVVFSSHVMALVEQLCSHVAVLAKGRVLASGLVDDVRGTHSLEAAFIDLVGDEARPVDGLAWLSS